MLTSTSRSEIQVYEGLDLVPHMCDKGDWFITFDLKSGYHHADIHRCQLLEVSRFFMESTWLWKSLHVLSSPLWPFLSLLYVLETSLSMSLSLESEEYQGYYVHDGILLFLSLSPSAVNVEIW